MRSSLAATDRGISSDKYVIIRSSREVICRKCAIGVYGMNIAKSGEEARTSRLFRLMKIQRILCPIDSLTRYHLIGRSCY